MQLSHQVELLGTLLFALAILHTFLANPIRAFSHRFKTGSALEKTFHLLGEVEIVFGFWSIFLFIGFLILAGTQSTTEHFSKLNFTEPMFVFVIMAMAATRPVLKAAEVLVSTVAKILPLPYGPSFYWVTLVICPLLGSFITEPAAMTVSALILKDKFFRHGKSQQFMYATLATLFVSVSIGGTLTHFAAPPILMVASSWGWDTPYVFTHFGAKFALAVMTSATLATFLLRKELRLDSSHQQKLGLPLWMVGAHVLFMAFVVGFAHYPVYFWPAFFVFYFFTQLTKSHQDKLKLKEAFLVGFFLGGLVVLGSLQGWWLSPLLQSMGQHALFFGATGLTAITDNAALTYLGSQVPNLSDPLKMALVAGAVTGGGLTVIANAPNPAGYAILQPHFGSAGVNPLRLFLYALIPTSVAVLAYYLVPTL
jgi:hypothetical protein